MATHDLYRRFNEAVCEQFVYGDPPWWQATPDTGRPLRYTGEPFGGAGVLAQWAAAKEKGFRLPTWMTSSAIGEFGGQVMGGATPVTVFHGYTRPLASESPETGEPVVRTGEAWRPYAVFNVEEVEGLPQYLYRPYREIRPVTHQSPEQGLNDYVNTLGADIYHAVRHTMASPVAGVERYDRHTEIVREVVRWTGHPARMNRRVQYGMEDGGLSYAREGLVVQIGTALLAAELGVPMRRDARVREDTSKAWRGLMLADEKATFRACRDASKAVDWLHRMAPGFRVDPSMSQAGVVLSDARQVAAAPPRGMSAVADQVRLRRQAENAQLFAARDARDFVGEACLFRCWALDGGSEARWKRGARRLLVAADRIDLGVPGVSAAIEAALAMPGPGPGQDLTTDAAGFLSAFRTEVRQRLESPVAAEGQGRSLAEAARRGGVSM